MHISSARWSARTSRPSGQFTLDRPNLPALERQSRPASAGLIGREHLSLARRIVCVEIRAGRKVRAISSRRSRKSDRLLCYDYSAHFLTMAPTRSGKGVGTIIPIPPKRQTRHSHILRWLPVLAETHCGINRIAVSATYEWFNDRVSMLRRCSRRNGARAERDRSGLTLSLAGNRATSPMQIVCPNRWSGHR